MKETRKLKKTNLPEGETDGKRVGKKIQRKKKVQVSNVELNEQSQDTQQANSSEKPKRKKVELKKKIQKSKEINSSPVDGKLNGKMKKRKEKVGNVDISEPNLEAISTEIVKGKKGKMNKTKKKRKAEEIISATVEADNLKGEGKSKKSNKKKKMDMTSTKENKIEEEEDVYQISSGDEDCTRGMKKWVTDYYEGRPGLDELQKRIDDFMTAHDERLAQEKQDREAKAAEGGWTVVVHHKGRKKTTETESGTAVGSFSQAALEDKISKKKQIEPVAHGFYRFQRREAQLNEILSLQSKFEQDKKRIQQLRAARRFKPF
ncbi:Ribosomal RNA-processing protein 7 C-terminal domain [Arabidopsis thaliana x Arabidopsis arenosa]|uniref:Ribosomal RNA-processing protein 7 C-terminal domain n=1 Tax=Arabidopsis thaliana x Arabidopsis arenosa TaxID=1240361 RepID=A0A8T1YD04_9BRAS|nr:Ribosomal RNA-processing protein 7 C-terminal domain [Arabidopsis thaliana x Arabidopsis arenosa]